MCFCQSYIIDVCIFERLMFYPRFSYTMCLKCVTIKSNEIHSKAIPAYCAAYKMCPCFAKGVHFLSYTKYFSLNLKFSFHCYVFAFFSFFQKSIQSQFYFLTKFYVFSIFFSFFFVLLFYKHDRRAGQDFISVCNSPAIYMNNFFLPSRLTPTLRLQNLSRLLLDYQCISSQFQSLSDIFFRHRCAPFPFIFQAQN